MDSTIFEKHYEDYLQQIRELDFTLIKDTLGIGVDGHEVSIPFFGDEYVVSKTGIVDNSGNRPDYMVCVVLSKYLLLCPDAPVMDEEWSALKDFHKMSQFTNVNVFTSDAERPIIDSFSGQTDVLAAAAQKLGGKPSQMSSSYDFASEFNALPRIKTLLLFNDQDDGFPASCSVLFQRQAESYLDPESLIMVGISLTKRLKKLAIEA